MAGSESATAARPDGRDTRWEAHRAERRKELVQAALRAIRKNGATVGMDEIAAVASTSKTVIYRHLGDRLGLYLAVCEAVGEMILADFDRAMAATGLGSGIDAAVAGDPYDVLTAVVGSYFELVERDPEVYRFVTRRPLVDLPLDTDPVGGLTDTIAQALTAVFREVLAARGADTSGAATWAYGLVGFVRESADRWLADPDRVPRQEVVGHLARFASVGLTGVLGPVP